MSARRVLIAWEFGNGLGHLACILPIVRKLRSRGIEPVVAVPAPDRAARIFGSESPRVIQAPLLSTTKRMARPLGSFADILLQAGFADARGLGEAVLRWQSVIRAEKIDCVLLDYAPVAQLAAWLMKLPMVTWTIPFGMPPVPLPPIKPWARTDTHALVASESELLGSINTVICAQGEARIDTLATWLHAPRRFAKLLPQTNVYGFEPEYGYLGAHGTLVGGIEVDWPRGNGPKVLAYLRSSPMTSRLVRSLHGSNLRVLCALPGADAESIDHCSAANVRAVSEPLAIRALLPDADIVLNHASGGLTCEALLAGKPQLLVPVDTEKVLTARRMIGAGLAAGMMPGSAAHGGLYALQDVLSKGTVAQAAKKAAVGLRLIDWEAQLDALADQSVAA
jgi:UDP:flavonoid glycosyltransferase YjiC (YdhE family)